jgi:hypothetical protein
MGRHLAVISMALAVALLFANTHAVADDGLPEVLVTGRAAAEPCANDAASGYACVNAELAALVARQRPAQQLFDDVVDASLPQTPTAQGLFNQTAMRIRMGSNFGHSVYPQRPAPASFRPPLIH